MLGAENGKLFVNGGTLDYVRFGEGERTLVMIPGVGDGLKTVRGMALPFALLYRGLARDFTVCLFSRGNALPAHITTREMAAELAAALDRLGIRRTAAVGVSQGGMIAQYLAVDYPEKVEKLVLAVTAAYANDAVKTAVNAWIKMAGQGDHVSLVVDTAEKMYSEKYLEKNRKLFPLMAKFTKPESYERFFRNAAAILDFDAREELSKISCPTLILAGAEDKTVGGEAARELNERIENSRLFVYEGLGHGAFEEARDFYDRVYAFFRTD